MYLAYLLRLWQTSRSGNTEWWASLEAHGIDERHSFTSLEALFAFLRQVTSDSTADTGLGSKPKGTLQTDD